MNNILLKFNIWIFHAQNEIAIAQCVFDSACLNSRNFHSLCVNCFLILLMGNFLFNTPETCEMPVPDSPVWSSLHAVSMPRVPCWQSIWDTNCCPFLWGWWPLHEQFSRLVSVPISARFQVTDVALLHPFCIFQKSIQSFPTRFWLLLLFKTFQLIVSCQPETPATQCHCCVPVFTLLCHWLWLDSRASVCCCCINSTAGMRCSFQLSVCSELLCSGFLTR